MAKRPNSEKHFLSKESPTNGSRTTVILKGKSVSGFLEEIIAQKLDAAGVPIPTVLKARPQRQSNEAEEIVSQHFTF